MEFNDVKNSIINNVKNSNANYNIFESRDSFRINIGNTTIEQLGEHYGNMSIESGSMVVTLYFKDIKDISPTLSGPKGIFIECEQFTMRINFR